MQTSPNSRYRKVGLHRDRQTKHYNINVLVLLAWRGAPQQGEVSCHENGDYHDNRLENLRWDTMKSNHADRERHGKTAKGTRGGQAKLTDDQVRAIRVDQRSQMVIAKEYDLGQSHVSRIKLRLTWQHLL